MFFGNENKILGKTHASIVEEFIAEAELKSIQNSHGTPSVLDLEPLIPLAFFISNKNYFCVQSIHTANIKEYEVLVKRHPMRWYFLKHAFCMFNQFYFYN